MHDSVAEPIWLSATQIADINKDVVAKTSEAHSILSFELLDSASARPRNLHLYDNINDIVVLGVRLLDAIGKNHCFQQGNKRTAFSACLLFMELNDVYVELPDRKDYAELMIKVILSDEPQQTLVDLFKKNSY